jgi:basic amino acid/polyamine antiporter, APA family
MEHLFQVDPLGSMVEETRETRQEWKRAVGPGSLAAVGVGIILCIYLSLSLPWQSYVGFVVWLALGIVVYLLYRYFHSWLRHAYSGAAGRTLGVAR